MGVIGPVRWVIVGGLMLMAGHATPLSLDAPTSPFDVNTYSSSEKALLPDYCRDTLDRAGRSVEGNPQQRRWLALMGETFWHMHHYCYGLVKKMRADAMPESDVVRSSLLRSAIEEMEYVRVRAPQDFILMPELWLRQGTYYAALGRPVTALECFERSRAAKADYWPAYVEAAKVNLTIRRRHEAIDILRAGLKIVPDQPSLKAELDRLTAEPVRQHAKPVRSAP